MDPLRNNYANSNSTYEHISSSNSTTVVEDPQTLTIVVSLPSNDGTRIDAGGWGSWDVSMPIECVLISDPTIPLTPILVRFLVVRPSSIVPLELVTIYDRPSLFRLFEGWVDRKFDFPASCGTTMTFFAINKP